MQAFEHKFLFLNYSRRKLKSREVKRKENPSQDKKKKRCQLQKEYKNEITRTKRVNETAFKTSRTKTIRA